MSGELLPWECRTRDEEPGALTEFQGIPVLPSLPCTCRQDLGCAHTQSRLRSPSNTESLGVLTFCMDKSHFTGHSQQGLNSAGHRAFLTPEYAQ